MYRSWLTALTLTLVLFPNVSRSGEALLGARALVEKATKSLGAPDSHAEDVSPAMAKREALAKAIKAFQGNSASLAPEAAAGQWLALCDAFAALPSDQSTSYRHYQFDEVFADAGATLDASDVSLPLIVSVIPGPDAWDALDKAIGEREGSTVEARQLNAALLILMDLVQGRIDGADKHIEAMKDSMKQGSDSPFGSYYGENADQRIMPLRDAIRRTVGFSSKKEVVEHYRELLAAPVEETERVREIRVPDLCRLTTDKEARELLRKTVLLEGVAPTVPSGGKTLKLLKAILLEEMENTKQPMWSLVNSPEDIALYEALVRKYPAREESEASSQGSLFMGGRSYRSNTSSNARRSAQFLYLVGLIAEGRIDDAVNLARAEPDGGPFGYYQLSRMVRGLDQRKLAASMFTFLETLLSDNSESRWWEFYASAALMAQQSNAALARLSEALESPTLEQPLRIVLLEKKSEIELGIGNVEVAIASLREISAMEVAGQGPHAVQLWYRIDGAARRLAQIGILLDRPDLVNAGVERTTAVSKQVSQGQTYGGSWYQNADLAGRLIESKRYAEAEKLILEGIVQALQIQAVDLANSGSAGMHSSDMLIDMSEQLELLVALYFELGRTDDVWYLLQEVPWWGVPTLPTDDETLVVAAAAALSTSGREDDAVKLLKQYILRRAGSDEAYEALLNHNPAGLLEWLDQLYTRDRFEERPLIWKAVVLKRRGKLDEAEAAVRQALKVDPTDGETEAGQRVMAYGILADILEAKGMADDAAFFRHVVRSVRTAEEGDKFSEAGLISRSIELYEQAEQDFADAYCVQWRLAERLHALGRYSEAEEHYEIAFKRMPEQFGRVASFCFGCNGVFQKEHSRSVAERILLRLLDQQPDNPQVHFLMGQLRQAQEENADAYDHFRRAVEIDPQYLDAWEKLCLLSQTLFLPKAETDAMVVQALQLDPMQRHFDSGIDDIAEIESMWNVMEKNLGLAVDDVDVEIELKATKSAMDEMLATMGSAARTMHQAQQSYNRYGYGQINPQRPGSALANHDVVMQLLRLLER